MRLPGTPASVVSLSWINYRPSGDGGVADGLLVGCWLTGRRTLQGQFGAVKL